MKIIGNRVLVLKDKPKQQTEGGIILPTTRQTNNTGVVETIGNKVLEIKENDKVMFYIDAGTPMNIDGKDYVLLTEDRDVISIL
tara:strand:- start:2064 stop:2315 length:252 start_codon:yes stop_codon:yes gene_type:complete